MTSRPDLRDIIVVGTSLAGLRTAEGLRAGGYTGRIHMVGDEPHAPYNRPPLSKELLLGKMTSAEVMLNGVEAIEATWHLGDAAMGLDPNVRTVQLSSGRSLAYDALVIATGVSPRWPDDLARGPGRISLRTLDDAATLGEALEKSKRIIVVGAGFIGCEVAASARTLGVEVALIDQSEAPLSALLGSEIAGTLADLHRANGVATSFGAQVSEVLGEDRVDGVRLADGMIVDGDLLLVGIGGRPSVAWLEGSGVHLDNGVVCDESLRVESDDGSDIGPIWAAGDVARWRHRTFDSELIRVEHWTNAALSGLAVAQNILGDSRPYTAIPEFWSDQYGINIRGIGRFGLGCQMRVEEGTPASGRFLASYWCEGKLSGVLSFGMTRALAKWRGKIGTSDNAGLAAG